jgi:hypothetical protein
MTRGQRVAKIAVLDPVSTLWSHQDAAGHRDATALRVMADWTAILRELIAAQRPHDTLDPLMLCEADVSDGVVRVGEAAYQILVMPSMLSLENAAWRKLEEFVSYGGSVIACGWLPEEEIEMNSDVVQRCAAAFAQDERGFKHVSGPHLVAALDELLPADLRIIPPSGDVLVAHRRDGDEDLFLIANSSESPFSCELPLNRGAARYDLETGALRGNRRQHIATGSLRLHHAIQLGGGGVSHAEAADQPPARRDRRRPGLAWRAQCSADLRRATPHSVEVTRGGSLPCQVRGRGASLTRAPLSGGSLAVGRVGHLGQRHTRYAIHTRKPPTSIRWSERHTSGFPYYAGTFHLSRASSLPELARQTRLRLPDAELMFAGLAELSVDGRSQGVRAWAPFAWTLPA